MITREGKQYRMSLAKVASSVLRDCANSCRLILGMFDRNATLLVSAASVAKVSHTQTTSCMSRTTIVAEDRTQFTKVVHDDVADHLYWMGS